MANFGNPKLLRYIFDLILFLGLFTSCRQSHSSPEQTLSPFLTPGSRQQYFPNKDYQALIKQAYQDMADSLKRPAMLDTLATAYLHVGQLDSATFYAMQAWQVRPEPNRLRSLMKICIAQEWQPAFREIASQFLLQFPMEPTGYLAMAKNNLAAGRPTEALQWVQQGLNRCTDLQDELAGELYYIQGCAQLSSGYKPLAKSSFQNSLRYGYPVTRNFLMSVDL